MNHNLLLGSDLAGWVPLHVWVNETLKLLLTTTEIDWFTAAQNGARKINKP